MQDDTTAAVVAAPTPSAPSDASAASRAPGDDDEGRSIVRWLEVVAAGIEQGTYGVCRDCGEMIAEVRLNAIPVTATVSAPLSINLGSTGTARLVNDAATVRWNLDKHYLGDLARRGEPCRQAVRGFPGREIASDCFVDVQPSTVMQLNVRSTASRSSASHCSDARQSRSAEQTFWQLPPVHDCPDAQSFEVVQRFARPWQMPVAPQI